MAPRTREFSARPACFTTSWYQAGKSPDCVGSAMARQDSGRFPGTGEAVRKGATLGKEASRMRRHVPLVLALSLLAAVVPAGESAGGTVTCSSVKPPALSFGKPRYIDR